MSCRGMHAETRSTVPAKPLTAVTMTEMRRRYERGEHARVIAQACGVHPQTVYKHAKKRRWRRHAERRPLELLDRLYDTLTERVEGLAAAPPAADSAERDARLLRQFALTLNRLVGLDQEVRPEALQPQSFAEEAAAARRELMRRLAAFAEQADKDEEDETQPSG